PDGKFIASSGDDNTLTLWNIANKFQIKMSAIGSDWVASTSDGIFDASRTGSAILGVTIGLQAFSLDQLALKNNRPDILFQKLGIGSKDEIDYYYHRYLKRLRKAGFSEDQLSPDYHVPEASIIHTDQTDKFVSISFRLQDSRYALKQYNVYVNGVPIFGAYGK